MPDQPSVIALALDTATINLVAFIPTSVFPISYAGLYFVVIIFSPRMVLAAKTIFIGGHSGLWHRHFY